MTSLHDALIAAFVIELLILAIYLRSVLAPIVVLFASRRCRPPPGQ